MIWLVGLLSEPRYPIQHIQTQKGRPVSPPRGPWGQLSPSFDSQETENSPSGYRNMLLQNTPGERKGTGMIHWTSIKEHYFEENENRLENGLIACVYASSLFHRKNIREPLVFPRCISTSVPNNLVRSIPRDRSLFASFVWCLFCLEGHYHSRGCSAGTLWRVFPQNVIFHFLPWCKTRS